MDVLRPAFFFLLSLSFDTTGEGVEDDPTPPPPRILFLYFAMAGQISGIESSPGDDEGVLSAKDDDEEESEVNRLPILDRRLDREDEDDDEDEGSSRDLPI